MRPMPTQSLSLRRCSDGYYRTQWTDSTGKVHNKSFGKDRRPAQNRFSSFFARWKSDPAVRNPSENALQSLRDIYKFFQSHAKAYYRRADGTPTGESNTIDQAMAPMLDLFGDLPVGELNQASLESARCKMVRDDLSISTINGYVRKIRHVWKWFANKGYVSPSTWHAMCTVSALKPGRALDEGGAALSPRSTEPITAVPEAFVLETCEHLPLTLKSMVMVQFFTGCRSTELCIMRPTDIDTSGAIWRYTPQRHKTQHHGKSREVAIGPQAQAWLRPILSRCLRIDEYLFKPADAWRERFAEKNADYVPEAPRGGDLFDRTTYARAIARVCKEHGIPHWHPNQLRHAAGTRARKEFGIEAASALLGHSKLSTTEIYAKMQLERADQAAAAIG